MRRPWNHLKKAVEALEPDPGDDALHQVRIRAKRARYAAEAAAPVVGKPARAFARAAADLQTVLGDHQDAVVAEEWLRREGSRGPAVALAAGQLIARQQVDAATTRERWPSMWKRASAKKLRAWFN